jgi:hypothetical protein
MTTQDQNQNENEQGEVVSFSAPRLNARDKLYLRVYLNTLSHSKAYESVVPGLKSYGTYAKDNAFMRKESIQYHISLALQERADALCITPELIIEKLFKEATREGAGSNHAARITALTQLGKHYGMFADKKESIQPIFNIISYDAPAPLVIDKVDKVIMEEQFDLPSNVELIEYN